MTALPPSGPWRPRDELQDLVFGGFRIVLPVRRPFAFDGTGLPDEILTASHCIGTVVPFGGVLPGFDLSDGGPEERRRRACESTGLPEETLRALEPVVAGLLDAGDLLWHDVLTTPRSVAALLGVLPPDRPWRVIGMGLPRGLLAAFLDGNGRSGIDDMLGRGLAMPAGGSPLGWEPLGYEWGWPHSWLCNGVPGVWGKAAGIVPGEWGLLSREEAERCVNWCNGDESKAEPVYWTPWLLTGYAAPPGGPAGAGWRSA